MKKYIKKNKVFIIASILITTILLLPFLSNGLYRGHDLQFHLSRLDGIVQAIKDRQFPIAIYPYKNFGYGYASPLFYSDLFLVVPALFGYLLNIPLLITYKIIVFTFVLFTCFTTMYVAYYFSRKKISSILASVILLFCNYYLTDMYIRCALGEIMAMAFIPLLVLEVYKFFYEDKENWISISIIFTCLLNSHNISFLFCVVLFGLIILINLKKVIHNKKMIINIIKATFLACLLCIVYILPMLEAINAQDLFIEHMQNESLKKTAVGLDGILNDIALQMNFSYSVSGLDEIDKYKSFGILILLLPILFVFNRNNKTNEYKYIRLLFIIGYLYVILSTKLIPLSEIDSLSFIQFPSRFYIIASVLFSIVISYSIKDYKNVALTIVMLVTFVSSLQYIYLYKTITNDNEVVIIPNNATAVDLFIDRKYAKVATDNVFTNREEVMNGEYLPYAFDLNGSGEELDYEKMGTELALYDLTPINIQYERNGTRLYFETAFDEKYLILLPQSYYKGYKAYEILDDGTRKELEIYNDEYTHRFGVVIPAGKHKIYTLYKGTFIQKTSLCISIATYVGLLVLIIKKKKSLI